MSRLQRTVCVLLAIIALLVTPLDALAMNKSKDNKIKKDDVPTPAFVYTYILLVYDKPTKESEILEEVPFAKPITKLKESQGWAKVITTNEVIGFCNAKQLTETNPNTFDVKMYCSQKEPEVYLRPSADSPIMGHVHRNERVHVVAQTPKCDWLRIEEDGYFCYIPRPCLDYEKYKDGELAWVAEKKLDVYYDEEVDAKFGTMYFGQEVTLVKAEGKRAKIRSKTGLIGYCDLSGLTKENPNSLNITCYTQVPGNYLFMSPTDDSGHRSINANEEMLLDAVDGDRFWARVIYKEAFYYVPFVFLDGGRRKSGTYKRVHTSTGASIKEGTRHSSKAVTTVPADTELLLIGATDLHARVATLPDANGQSQIGFIEIEYIK
ncbi:MAG: hypothetical protein ACSW8J_03905 [bacterium]